MNFIEEKIENKLKEKNYLPVFRFPPENNGILHLGHAKAITLNFGLAEKYNSKCYLRIDDTNPLTEDSSFTEKIIEDIKWLGYEFDVRYTSDYFNDIKNCAIHLIKNGLAYIDKSSSEEIAEMKGTPTTPGVNSKYRNTDIEENLKLFNDMISGKYKSGDMVLRAKINMGDPNMILRDPVIYRIIDKEHDRVGNLYAYPTYDFAHPLSDYYDGVTDSLCSLEFEVHRPLYNWVIEYCIEDKFVPEQTEFNRLMVDGNVLSKRHIKKLIDNKIVKSWDDPRLLTLKGLKRRGYTPNSIKEFCKKAGYTKRNTHTDIKLLESTLREELNKTAFRYMGVSEPIKLTIKNWDKGTEWLIIENNPENPDDGKRTVPFNGELWIEKEDFRIEANSKYNRLKLNGEVRLKGAYVVKAVDYVLDDNNEVKEVICTYDPDTKSGMKIDRKIKGTIHWCTVEHSPSVEFNEYEDLFIPNEKGEYVINNESLNIKEGYVEINCLELSNVPIQFMRKGYYILDTNSSNDNLIFNKTTSLRERKW
jgi:glutaminyl-tRNA synthetase